MNILNKRIILSCAAISIASVAFLANANEPHSSDCKDQASKEQCMDAHMDKDRAEHEKKLHDALKLTASQEPAWKTFTDSINQQMDSMHADHQPEPSHADMEKLSAPDRLQRHIDGMQKHLVTMQAHLASLKSFYAVLTPDQQTTMNKDIARVLHHRDHGMHD